jgi:hypothetical protein
MFIQYELEVTKCHDDDNLSVQAGYHICEFCEAMGCFVRSSIQRIKDRPGQNELVLYSDHRGKSLVSIRYRLVVGDLVEKESNVEDARSVSQNSSDNRYTYTYRSSGIIT